MFQAEGREPKKLVSIGRAVQEHNSVWGVILEGLRRLSTMNHDLHLAEEYVIGLRPVAVQASFFF